MNRRQTTRPTPIRRDSPSPDRWELLASSFPALLGGPPQKSVQNPYKSDHFREYQFSNHSAAGTCNFSALKRTDFQIHNLNHPLNLNLRGPVRSAPHSCKLVPIRVSNSKLNISERLCQTHTIQISRSTASLRLLLLNPPMTKMRKNETKSDFHNTEPLRPSHLQHSQFALSHFSASLLSTVGAQLSTERLEFNAHPALNSQLSAFYACPRHGPC